MSEFIEDSEITSPLEEMKNEVYLQDAPLGKRLANSILDSIFSMILMGSFFALLAFFGLDNDVVINLVTILFSIGYYVILEGFFGQTLGKIITKTVVVAEDGSKPSLGTICLRTIVRSVPFEALSFLGSRPTGWHDRWSKTRVVSKDYVEYVRED